MLAPCRRRTAAARLLPAARIQLDLLPIGFEAERGQIERAHLAHLQIIAGPTQQPGTGEFGQSGVVEGGAGEGAADIHGATASDAGVVAEVAAASMPAADSSLPADVDSSSAPAASAAADPSAELLAEIDALDPAAVLRLAGAPARRRLPPAACVVWLAWAAFWRVGEWLDDSTPDGITDDW